MEHGDAAVLGRSRGDRDAPPSRRIRHERSIASQQLRGVYRRLLLLVAGQLLDPLERVAIQAVWAV